MDRTTASTAATWVTNRAWSRAGAIALTMSSGAPRRLLRTGTRVAMLVGGSLLISVAVAAMLWNSFGPGPLDVFITGLRETTGISLTFAYWTAFGAMLVLALVLGRRPGLGTVATPLILGPAVQALLAVFERVDSPGAVWMQVVVHLLAIGMAGIGAGALIESGLGAGTGELLAMAASDRIGRPEPHVRLGFEMSWLVLGIVLGGSFGAGTVIVAALIGPSVANGYRIVHRLADASRRHAAASVHRVATPV